MEKKHVCPLWLGYFLLNPLRKLRQNPQTILGEYIKPGMSVIDYGTAMGYFSIPMAKMTGPNGKVYCFDIQEKMLQKLKKRAKNHNVQQIIETRLISEDGKAFSDLDQKIDFTLLFAVVHEVPDRQYLFKTLNAMMKNNSKLLIGEPKGHVSNDDFEQSIGFALNNGFKKIETLNINGSHGILMEKI